MPLGIVHAPLLEVHVAKVGQHDRIAVILLERPLEELRSEFQLVLTVVDPAQTVQVRAVVRLLIQGPLNQVVGLVQMDAAVGEHVTQIVQGTCVVWIDFDQLAKACLRLVVILGALMQGAECE